MPGFQLSFDLPVDNATGPHRPEVSVGIRLIWPDGATISEITQALATAAAHALTEYERREA
jgi:hypothetical protein